MTEHRMTPPDRSDLIRWQCTKLHGIGMGGVDPTGETGKIGTDPGGREVASHRSAPVNTMFYCARI